MRDHAAADDDELARSRGLDHGGHVRSPPFRCCGSCVSPSLRGSLPVPTGSGEVAGVNHSTRAQTSSRHPPQPVVARVAVATCATLVAPSSTHAAMAALVTPLHRQTVASSARSAGEVGPRPWCGARAGSSRYAGSAGTGVRRVYVVTRSAATAPAPTHVAPTSRPPETTTSTCRPTSGSLSRRVRWAGSSSRADPHTPMVTTSRPCALRRTTSLPDVDGGGAERDGRGSRGRRSLHRWAASRRDCSHPCATRPVPPSGGCAQSPIANTRRSSGQRRSSSTTTPRSTRSPAPAASSVLGTVPVASTRRSAGTTSPSSSRSPTSRPPSTRALVAPTPTRWSMPRFAIASSTTRPASASS